MISWEEFENFNPNKKYSFEDLSRMGASFYKAENYKLSDKALKIDDETIASSSSVFSMVGGFVAARRAVGRDRRFSGGSRGTRNTDNTSIKHGCRCVFRHRDRPRFFHAIFRLARIFYLHFLALVIIIDIV